MVDNSTVNQERVFVIQQFKLKITLTTIILTSWRPWFMQSMPPLSTINNTINDHWLLTTLARQPSNPSTWVIMTTNETISRNTSSSLSALFNENYSISSVTSGALVSVISTDSNNDNKKDTIEITSTDQLGSDRIAYTLQVGDVRL